MTIEERKKRAEEISSHPQFFVVCECCEAIVKRGRTFCPACGGYHFDENPSAIRKHAEILANRPQEQEVIHWEF